MAFLHPLAPWPSQNRVEEAFLFRLGHQLQTLGYTPLFILDRGFDRVTPLRQLQAWGMGFLIRLRGGREVRTRDGERFILKERYSRVDEPRREVGVLSAHNGSTVEVELFLAQGRREAWYLAFWSPLEWEPKNYRLRMWVEEGFRDLKG